MAFRHSADHDIRSGRVVAGILFAAIGVGFLLESLAVWHVDLVYLWPVLLIGIGVSFLLGRAKRLRIEEDRSAALAVAEERVRIARELHDIVAHGVSLMTIQIAAARRVATRQPEAADQALAAAEDAGRQSLAELRSLLAVLRSADDSLGEVRLDGRPLDGDLEGAAAGSGSSLFSSASSGDAPTSPLPRLADIPDLVDGLRAAGLDVRFDQDGLVPGLTPATELTLYRVVQESLTNVVRHTRDARVVVRLTYAPEGVDLLVEDDGGGGSGGVGGVGGFASTPGPASHGLVGMRERVAAVGGTITVGPRNDGPGWRVAAKLPAVVRA